MLNFQGLWRIKRGVLAVKINVILILCWCSSPADISVSAPWRILKSSSEDNFKNRKMIVTIVYIVICNYNASDNR